MLLLLRGELCWLHETITICQLCGTIRGRQRADRKAAAAGWFVAVWIIEIDTDWLISPGTPAPCSSPASGASSEANPQVKLE